MWIFPPFWLCNYFLLDALHFPDSTQCTKNSRKPCNSVHAADVTQAMACFLAEPLIKKHLTPLEVMASLVAAVCHDVDHPGFNEKFLIASSSHLAGLYHNASVLENHHWRTAISMMRESGLADLLTTTDLAEMQV